MPPATHSSPRKSNLIAFLRDASNAFINQTDDGSPSVARESIQLRGDLESLWLLYLEEIIDPSKVLAEAPLLMSEPISEPMVDPADAPLGGANP